MGLRVGTPIEVAVWLTGRETFLQLRQWHRDCRSQIAAFGTENGVIMTPPVFIEKRPGEDRVPQVPAHISGPDVRLLVYEACVAVHPRPAIITSGGFVNDLAPDDLAKLRKITRQCHAQLFSAQPNLTDAQCDAYIEEIGPETAIKMLRKHSPDSRVH